MNNKITNIEFLKKLYDRHGDEYKLIGEYEHSQKKVTLLHNKCGMTTKILPSNAISKRLPIPCRYCNPNSKKDTEIFQYQLHKNNPEFEVVSEYLGANKPIKVKHNNCGKILNINYAGNILKDVVHCPYCHKGSFANTNTFEYKVNKMYGDEYTILSEYVNSRTRIKIRHNICHFDYEVMPNEFLRKREKCPFCTKKSKKKNDMSIRKELKEKYGNKFKLLEPYKTVNDCYDFKCNSCGRISNLELSHVLSNHIQCPYCGDGISYPEKFMRSLLRQLKLNFVPEYSSKNCDWCGGYRYDFYLSDYNWIIEVHGLQHYKDGWQKLTVTQQNDTEKKELALRHGIDKYIIIDAKRSEVEYLKTNILNSDLSIFNLNKIDWGKCNLDANKQYFKDVINLWNNGYEVKEISNMIDLSPATIHKKLTDARITNLLTRQYGEGVSTARSKATSLRNSKKVKCLETGEIFNSAKEADIFYSPNNKYHENVSHCARKQQSTAYGLHWQYV